MLHSDHDVEKITILETKLMLLGVSIYERSCAGCYFFYKNGRDKKCLDILIDGVSINHYCMDNWERIRTQVLNEETIDLD
jgi:hypothetical protein